MHIQKMFVIITFNEHLVETAVDLLGRLPLGDKVQGPFKDLLNKQKEKLHRKPGQGVAQVRHEGRPCSTHSRGYVRREDM